MRGQRRVHGAVVCVLVAILAVWSVPGGTVHAATRCVNPGGTGGCFSKIQDAINAATSGDTITLAAGTYLGDIVIDRSLTVQGAAGAIIDGGGPPSGTAVVRIPGGVTANLRGLTVQNGYNSPVTGSCGGGILNSGIVTVTNSSIINNQARDAGAGICNGGTMTISNSTIAGNHAYIGGGGGIIGGGPTTVINSTITGNSAAQGGGVAYNMTVANSIIAGNHADMNSSGEAMGPDVFQVITSRGYNLIGDTTGGSGFIASDLLNIDPKLGALGNNGGPTPTMLPAAGSPAISVIPPVGGCNNAGITTDQRGVKRPQGVACDIGAVEVQSVPASLLIGDKTIESNIDRNPPGIAEAFAYTAKATGTTTTLSVYLDDTNAASQVVIGIYSNTTKNHPGTLLSQATITSPIAGAWNAVALPASQQITADTKYWIAILGPASGGAITFRDKQFGGREETSKETNLTALPATWTTGTEFTNAPLSAYAI